MIRNLSTLHPNPGWAGSEISTDKLQATTDSLQATIDQAHACTDHTAVEPVGKHCILELYGCNPARLDDEAFLRSLISTSVQQAGATLLNLITHHFEPQGVTGLALLAESHLSIHTWPESGYAAVDVFTCGDHTMPERACLSLLHALEATDHRLRSFRRQTPASLQQQQRSPL